MRVVKLNEFLVNKTGSVNPSKHPDEVFDLFSIPAYESGIPDRVLGSEIGSSKKKIKPGDVILSRIVPHIRRCWVVPPSDDYRQIGSGEWILFRSDRFDSDFLRYFLLSEGFHRQFMRTTKGVGGSLLRADIKQTGKIKIPLPPLPQQRRIVRALDLADRQRRLLREEIAGYERLGESLFLEMFGDPVRNNRGWEKKKLKTVTTKIGSGATPRGGKEAYLEEGIPLVRSLNIHDNRFKKKNLAFISDNQARKLDHVVIDEDDVLFNITGASVCRCAYAPFEVVGGRVNQHVAILRPQPQLLKATYLLYYLISPGTKQKLLSLAASGGATREAITKAQLQNFKISLPPIELQTCFVEQVNKVKYLKKRAQKSLIEADDLFHTLLQRAFRGELFAALPSPTAFID